MVHNVVLVIRPEVLLKLLILEEDPVDRRFFGFGQEPRTSLLLPVVFALTYIHL